MPHQFDNQIWYKKGFPDKAHEDEDIVLVVREDLIILLFKGIGLFLFTIALLILRIIVLGVDNPTAIYFYDVFFYGMNVVLISFFVLIFHNYILSIQIVTNERLIDIDQKGLFNREVNILPIANIEDVTYKQNGIIGSIFNFGNVVVQSAGEESSGAATKTNGFVFENVPQPSSVSKYLIRMYQHKEVSDRQETAQANAEALQKVLRGEVIRKD